MYEKALKREARGIWAELRRERRARAKLLRSEELTQSADRVVEIAVKLRALADHAHTLEDKPANDDAPAKPAPKKPSAKKANKRPVATKKAKAKKNKKI